MPGESRRDSERLAANVAAMRIVRMSRRSTCHRWWFCSDYWWRSDNFKRRKRRLECLIRCRRSYTATVNGTTIDLAVGWKSIMTRMLRLRAVDPTAASSTAAATIATQIQGVHFRWNDVLINSIQQRGLCYAGLHCHDVIVFVVIVVVVRPKIAPVVRLNVAAAPSPSLTGHQHQ